jgi:serine/threonine-protein kinase
VREAIHGTMSQFYVVRDKKTNELFGLKVCDGEKRGTFESRFAGLDKPSEGEIGLLMDHPNIVKTLEHGETVDGQYYVLLEFIDGPGVNVVIKSGERAVVGKRGMLIQQMAEALSYVHKAGFIHRDICPRNYICNQAFTKVTLIDFGLTVPATKHFMQPGNRSGTPNYMSPEVVRRRKTDQRLDIFSFGVTTYQLLTFELPWPGGDVTGKAAMAHDTKPPVDIFELQPELNPRLGETIMTCLSVDPDGRPRTMDDFLMRVRGIDDEFQP